MSEEQAEYYTVGGCECDEAALRDVVPGCPEPACRKVTADEVKRLRAENERLRAALRTAHRMLYLHHLSDYLPALSGCCRICKDSGVFEIIADALNEPKPEPEPEPSADDNEDGSEQPY